jgi:hypothetical protein
VKCFGAVVASIEKREASPSPFMLPKGDASIFPEFSSSFFKVDDAEKEPPDLLAEGGCLEGTDKG